MNSHNTKKNNSGQPNRDVSQGIFFFWKEPGETLAVMLRRFRDTQGLSEDEKLTYAGRLDPMAEGIVPILVGEARFQKDHMLRASKTYEVDILLGIGTDTGDMLGLPTVDLILNAVKDKNEIEKALLTLSETVSLPYPNYSSRPVDGKPLFMHARAKNTVVVPIKNITIYSLELLGVQKVLVGDLLKQAIETIKKVQGDFRQSEIIEQWSDLCKKEDSAIVQLVHIKTTVSSGTYMRSVAEKMGELVRMPALAYKITRTEVKK
jgi:tRNA pseudouridine(55) synthase